MRWSGGKTPVMVETVVDLFIQPHIYVRKCFPTFQRWVWWSEIGLLLLHLFNTVHILQLDDFALGLGTWICRGWMGESREEGWAKRWRTKNLSLAEWLTLSVFKFACVIRAYAGEHRYITFHFLNINRNLVLLSHHLSWHTLVEQLDWY